MNSDHFRSNIAHSAKNILHSKKYTFHWFWIPISASVANLFTDSIRVQKSSIHTLDTAALEKSRTKKVILRRGAIVYTVKEYFNYSP